MKTNKKDKNYISTKHLLKRLWRNYLSNYIGLIFTAIIFMVITAASEAYSINLFEKIIDDGFVSKNKEILQFIAIQIIIVTFIKSVSFYIQTIKINKVGLYTVNDLQRDMFNKIIYQDNYFFQNNTTGTLLSRFTADAFLIEHSVARILTTAFKDILTAVFMIIVMFLKSVEMSLVALVGFPLTFYLVSKLGKSMRKTSSTSQETIGKLSYHLEQIFQGIKVVKSYCMEKYEKSKMSNMIDSVFKISYKKVKIRDRSRPIMEFLGGIVVSAALIYGGFKITKGELTTGEFITFLLAFLALYRPIKALGTFNVSLQEGLAGVERIFNVIDSKVKIKEKKNAKTVTFKTAEIEFKNVNFTYIEEEQAKEKNLPVIENMNLKIKPNTITALVGESGAGKSTILNLIPRFFDIDSGEILINKNNIKDIALQSLRSQIALVSQDIVLFDDTVFNNIAYGAKFSSNKQIDKKDVINAAKKVNLHEFIMSLPKKYDTVIGERGMKFSGGQRQRLSIARAFLKNAPILLLDEATSSLDNKSEKIIQESLNELMKGKTTIVVAHRLSTIINADKICVLDKGKIIETGTHKTLLKKDGLYAKLYKIQFAEK